MTLGSRYVITATLTSGTTDTFTSNQVLQHHLAQQAPVIIFILFLNFDTNLIIELYFTRHNLYYLIFELTLFFLMIFLCWNSVPFHDVNLTTMCIMYDFLTCQAAFSVPILLNNMYFYTPV